MPVTPQGGSIVGTNFRRRRPGYVDFIQGQHGTATKQVLFNRQKEIERQAREFDQSQRVKEFDYQKARDIEMDKQAATAQFRSMGPAVMNLTNKLGNFGKGPGPMKDSPLKSATGFLDKIPGASKLGGFNLGNIVSGAGLGFGVSRLFGDPKDKKSRALLGAGGGALSSFLTGGSLGSIAGGGLFGGLLSLWS